MKEEKEGLVRRVEGKFAYIAVSRPEMCQECTLCGKNSAHELKAENSLNAGVNDRVIFSIDIDTLNWRFIKILLAATVALLCGAIGGYLLTANYLVSFIAAAVALLSLFFLVRDKESPDYVAKIIKIINNKEEA